MLHGDGSIDRRKRVGKDRETIIGFVFDHATPVGFDDRLCGQLHSSHHRKIVDNAIFACEQREARHVKHEDCKFCAVVSPERLFNVFPFYNYFALRVLKQKALKFLGREVVCHRISVWMMDAVELYAYCTISCCNFHDTLMLKSMQKSMLKISSFRSH